MRIAQVSVSLAVLFFVFSGCDLPIRQEAFMPNTRSQEADLRAIEALNQQDRDAAMASDVSTITSQWTDDFVMIPGTGPIIRGRKANVEMAERGKQQVSMLEPLEYEVDFVEINVIGDYAYEWGTYRGMARPRAGGQITSYSGKLMRILQRQPDGSWKMHRTMATVDPPAQ